MSKIVNTYNLIALLVFLHFGVCTSLFAKPATTNIAQSVVELTKGNDDTSIVLLYPNGSLNNIVPIIKQFTQLTNIKVELKEVSVDNINTKMLLSAAQQKYDFDVALPASFGIPDLVEANALYDLSSFVKRYQNTYDYKASLYSLADSYKGAHYGFQTDGDVYTMFYQKSWFKNEKAQQDFETKYGRALTIPTTWSELDQLMAFFHQPSEQRYGGCLFRTPRYMVWEWWIRFHESKQFPVDDNMHPNIASDAGVKALTNMIASAQHLHPKSEVNGLFENWQVFSDGSCFANIGWGGSQKFFNKSSSKIKGNMIHTPTPGVSYFNWGWNYVVSKHAKHPEIAYLFALFATSSDMSIASVRQDGFFDPFREEHYDDQVITDAYTSEFLLAHKRAMSSAIPDFYLEGQGRYINALQEGLMAAYEGIVSPTQALTFVTKEWEDITEEIGRSEQIEQWLRLKQKYPASFFD